MSGLNFQRVDHETAQHTVNEIELQGCAPVPLAHYLKALAILRLVAEQADSSARGRWEGDKFVLVTSLSEGQLVEFFLERYAPTPIVAPWNGGSGFNPKDNKSGIDALAGSRTERLGNYREAIAAAFQVLKTLRIETKVSEKQKPELLMACRSILPDSSVVWLDAAYVLTSDGAKFPPLLGTGGNDGRLEFTNNFMQRICDLMSMESGEPAPASEIWLKASLFGTETDGLQRSAIGQFHPSAAGGSNQSAGFDSNTQMNPWDYVLMIEGALLFAGATVKKLESAAPRTLSYPFSVRSSGVGYGSSSLADESSSNSRAEIWLPLWSESISYLELQTLMAEGRAQVAGRSVRNGVDFARAVATLGVDRGLTEFQRYGFQVRNGLSYFATPIGRFAVHRQPQVSLLNSIDRWLDRFSGRAKSDNAPSSAARAVRNLETAIVALTQRKGVVEAQAVLVALGACEAAMSQSFKWAADKQGGLRPIGGLNSQWLEECYDGSVEYRLAASLASLWTPYKPQGALLTMPLRAHMTPLRMGAKNGHQWAMWLDDPDRNIVWEGASLETKLVAVLKRRLLLATQSGHSYYQDRAAVYASLSDIAMFVEGRTDDAKIEALLRGLTLIDWPTVSEHPFAIDAEISPDATYTALKLCFAGRPVNTLEIPVAPSILKNAAAGNPTALRTALRRLHASGVPLAVSSLWADTRKLQRLAAALIFPVSPADTHTLVASIARPTHD